MNSATQSPVVLEAQNIYKSFTDGKSHVDVITGLSLQVAQGEFVSIVGSSGSGKSTLLHILGGLDRPTQGLVNLNGKRFDNLGEAERGFLRNEHLGFVYQFHHLLPEFTALENVAMPLMLRKDAEYKKVKERAEYLLERVGLSHRLTHQPGELSGGERQRVCVWARCPWSISPRMPCAPMWCWSPKNTMFLWARWLIMCAWLNRPPGEWCPMPRFKRRWQR